MIGLALLLLSGLGLLWLTAIAWTVWMLTHPPRRTYSSAVSRGRPGDPTELPTGPRTFESWTFRSGGLDFPVWDIPGDAPSGPVVILTHGWADSRIGGLVRVGALAPVASRILIWDMPGHGEAPGICRLGTTEVDHLLALIEHLGPTDLVLVGWSLGAGVSIAAARALRESHIRIAVIAEAPYRLAPTPAANVLRARGLPVLSVIAPSFALLRINLGNRLAESQFDRAILARDLTARVLVIRGADDIVCPEQDGRDIAAAGKGRFVGIPDAGHNDLWTQPESLAKCTQVVQDFIRTRETSRQERP